MKENLITQTKACTIPDGVQVIIKAGKHHNPLLQEYLIIQDANDRQSGTGIKKYGIPGGAIFVKERIPDAADREVREEVGMYVESIFFGSFTKQRGEGVYNTNHLFIANCSKPPLVIETQDKKEVSCVRTFNLLEIVDLYQKGRFHVGSIRLIFHFLNGTEEGNLDEPVKYLGWTF